MQQQLISLNPDLQRLENDGYDIMVTGGHLLVHQIPYVNQSKTIEYGTLVCVLTYSTPTKLTPPKDHTIYFIGKTPCNSSGEPLDSIINNSQPQQLGNNILVHHYFSSKPLSGNYIDHYEKIRTYSEIISINAKMIDNSITTKPKKK